METCRCSEFSLVTKIGIVFRASVSRDDGYPCPRMKTIFYKVQELDKPQGYSRRRFVIFRTEYTMNFLEAFSLYMPLPTRYVPSNEILFFCIEKVQSAVAVVKIAAYIHGVSDEEVSVTITPKINRAKMPSICSGFITSSIFTQPAP